MSGNMLALFIMVLASGALGGTMSQMPIFMSVTCRSNKKVDLEVRFAKDLYIKIGHCKYTQLITTNNRQTIPMNCKVDWNIPFVAQLTAVKNIHQDGEPQRHFICVAKEGTVQGVTYAVNGPTVSPGNYLTDTIEAILLIKLTKYNETTPVTAAHLGDVLCMYVYLDDDFKDDYSIQVNTILLESGGETVYLTGGPGALAGCQNSNLWAEVVKLSEAEMRVCFTVFAVLPTKKTAITHVYKATINVCLASEFKDCYVEGCLAPTTPTARRKRDVSNTTSEQIEVSTSLIILGENDENDNGNGNVGAIGGAQEQMSSEECEVCMKKSVLYGLIAFFIPALLLAFGASVCLYMKTRKQRKTVEEIEIITRKSSGSLNSSARGNPSFRN